MQRSMLNLVSRVSLHPDPRKSGSELVFHFLGSLRASSLEQKGASPNNITEWSSMVVNGRHFHLRPILEMNSLRLKSSDFWNILLVNLTDLTIDIAVRKVHAKKVKSEKRYLAYHTLAISTDEPESGFLDGSIIYLLLKSRSMLNRCWIRLL